MLPATATRTPGCRDLIQRLCARHYRHMPTGSRLPAALKNQAYDMSAETWWGMYNQMRVVRGVADKLGWDVYNPFPRVALGGVYSETDAMIRNYGLDGETVEATFEVKCPAGGVVSNRLFAEHYEQCCAEMEAYGTRVGVVAVWTPLVCNVFEVRHSPAAWTYMMQKLERKISRELYERVVQSMVTGNTRLLATFSRDDSPLFLLEDLSS
jgi:hypothetical protein